MKNEKKPEKTFLQKIEEQADVEVKTFPRNLPSAQHAKGLLKRAGKALTPEGYKKYKGCAVVFFYEKEVQLQAEMATITICPMEETITEPQAFIGFEQLKNKFMSSFGRKPKLRKGGKLGH